jgi:phosphate:Na+ symporter
MDAVLGILAGVGLFLYGMSVMADGLRAVAGERARVWLASVTAHPLKAVGVGAVATAVLGSSSLLIIIVIALVDVGLLPLVGAIGVVLGANIGTTVASQLFAFDAQRLGPILLLIGLVATLAGRTQRAKDLGRLLLGVGMLFYGLHELDESAGPLGRLPQISSWLASLSNPLMGAGVGAAVTVLIQASSATVALAITFVRDGLISLSAGVAVMLGAEIGTCADTLVATVGRSPSARRLGLFHLAFNVATVIVALPLIEQFTALAVAMAPGVGPARTLANAHILFNTLGVLVALPFVPALGRMLGARNKHMPLAPTLS